jgi:hypothetical protein
MSNTITNDDAVKTLLAVIERPYWDAPPLTEQRDALEALCKRLAIANKALADLSYLLADVDHPKVRTARIGIINTLQSTDLVNPNL